MSQKAPIYTEENIICNSELLRQLQEAVLELEYKMTATVPIEKGGSRVGFGVNKAQRGIAANQVIFITRTIKSLKGW